jgi:hypothetical protein
MMLAMPLKGLEQLHLAPHAAGCLVAVKAVPGASRDRVAAVLGTRLKITVSRPPEKGAANLAVAEVLARALGLKARDVELVSGPTNPEKTFLVRGLAPDEVRRRLSERIP